MLLKLYNDGSIGIASPFLDSSSVIQFASWLKMIREELIEPLRHPNQIAAQIGLNRCAVRFVQHATLY